MKTLKPACIPRKSIFDPSKRDTVLDITDLIENRISADEFFAENYITEGMKVLLTEGFRRLEGKSAQGVFKLTQAMGGGKTHNLLALGLLAQHSEYRQKVMSDFYRPGNIGFVRVVAFSGRESDVPFGIWGAIAEQLGKKEQLRDYYSPLSAPGQTAWINLLKGEPLVILLDELPAYFVNAKSKAIGNSDLSVVTSTALSNLLVALGKDELYNICLVITDLTASYGEGSQQMIESLSNLEKETGRSAMNLEPVQMNTDEFYHILRKRIFEKLLRQDDIVEVAQAYAKAVRDARQMDVTHATPEKFAQTIMESYPFHPAIRDLYARFKENPGFQQTRGLIRLMRIVTARIWNDPDDTGYLISAHDIDLNDRETLTEINQINNTLENAISHDIASHGQAVAEVIDTNLGTTDAVNVMRLLLISSLANVPGAIRGLTISEIIANLCGPHRDSAKIKNDVISRLVTSAWYVHTTGEGKLFIKNVQNLVARLTTTAQSYLRDQSVKELKERLNTLFKPDTGWCYQKVLTLPAVDEIDLSYDKVVLVITEPHPDGLHSDLRKLYAQLTFPNRICFLTGQRNFDSLLTSARELKAINHIIGEMESERVSDNDPQMVQARDLLDRIQNQFLSSIRETFTTIFFPTKDRLMKADIRMEFTENRYSGEDQIIKTLTDKYKYTDDVASDTFRKKVEARIFTQKTMQWAEVKRRAAMNTSWQWHRIDALDKLKDYCIHQEIWREEGGYVEKGPFPKPATDIKIQELQRNTDTGSVKLRLTPVNGDTIFYEIGAPATPASMKLSGKDFETHELEVSFLVVDSHGDHETGKPVQWKNRITIKSRTYQAGEDKMVELRAAPPASIRYTTDGSDPKLSGGVYEEPFSVPKDTRLVLACAEHDDIHSEIHKLEIDWEKGEVKQIDRAKPALWRPHHGFKYSNTRTSYGFIKRLNKYKGKAAVTRLAVLNEHWADLSFADNVMLEPEQIENTVEHLRSVITEGEVTIEASYLWFPTGQNLFDYVHELKVNLNSHEVEQDEL
jgi:hypothetical protein